MVYTYSTMPVGYVLQDVVADAMTVAAVEPTLKINQKKKWKTKKKRHTVVKCMEGLQ